MAQITLRDYLQETEDAISSGRTDDALQRCHHVLDRFPDSLEAQRLLGEVYLALDRLDEAQRAFDWVLTNDPENVIAYCDRALVCERRSDYDTALDCYQQAYELSRGNSEIRNEFNKLSVKANLPGFMFSRAGLARLYMRGDLMTQAILEWEAVLSTNVDRLDARTGMIEACWRDGQYDQVEQMAQELLQDVPACIKALLLLAHVLSTKNLQQARDLVHQAENLDPDLLTAQELFSDLFASRQAESFLQLLKRPPVTLDPTAVSQVASQASALNVSNNGILPSPLAESLPQPPADASIPVWTSQSMPGFEVPATPSASGEHAEQQSEALSLSIPQIESCQELPQIDATPGGVQPESDEQKEEQELSSSDLAGVDLWEDSEADISFASAENPFANAWTGSQAVAPPPPAWLNMLTQGERQQLSGTTPPDAPQSTASPAPDLMSKSPEQETVASAEPTPQLPPLASDEDESFFGPEWLKALGAETINGVKPEPEEDVFIAPTPTPVAQPEKAQPKFDVPPKHDVPSTPARSEAPMIHEEAQPYYATLDDLDLSLRARGFVDMAPNSLAEIAKTNNIALQPIPAAQEEPVDPIEADDGLSDALAQLASFSSPYQARPPSERQEQQVLARPDQEDNILFAAPSARPTEIDDTAIVVEPSGPMEMPDWVTLLEQTVSPPTKAPRLFAAQQEDLAIWQETEQPPRVTAGPVFEPSRVPPTPIGSPSASLTAARSNPLLENELETTMRRPAVRLQQLQQARAAGQREHLGRASSGSLAKRGGDGPLSHHDRLVKGYQYQLSGDYDEAMNEYRLIIKTAPDLLSEVVSNLRVLLKLAPKYVAAYRVLGDAYMKQGEYLQAMEAYNKALTMAKRAK